MLLNKKSSQIAFGLLCGGILGNLCDRLRWGFGVGIDVFASVEDACDKAISVTDEINPGENAGRYNENYSLYGSLYATLKESFETVSRIGES